MTPLAPAAGDDGWIVRLLQTAGAAIFGAMISLVAFRTRLSNVDRDIAELRSELKRQREDTDRRHEENRESLDKHMLEVNRRQRMTLDIIAAIARKVGVDHRFTDVLVRFLNEEEAG